MRATAFAVTALFLTTPLALVAPTAAAFDWCSDAVPGRECWSHWTCIGIRRDYVNHREWCQYEVPPPCDTVCIRDPCDWLFYCGPGPALP